jgi:hypothetical protein
MPLHTRTMLGRCLVAAFNPGSCMLRLQHRMASMMGTRVRTGSRGVTRFHKGAHDGRAGAPARATQASCRAGLVDAGA